MNPFLGMFFAFVTSGAVAVSFRAPRRTVVGIGLTGCLGYAANYAAVWTRAPETLAVFIGALVVGTVGEWLARRLKEPTILFILPGLFPLLPGLIAYNGMLHLTRNDLGLAGRELARTAFYAGALASGLALPPVLVRRILARWSDLLGHLRR